jgi:alpha-L-fucosidase
MLLAGVCARGEETPNLVIAQGPFKSTLESLSAYKCPDWFRDAKFGIWAHWGPQSVPMAGDWYAKNMYVEGSGQYKHHLEHYGHPSKFGYKDIIPLWKAEKWDPDHLMALYKRAGARYFVSMATHHDNFFLWDSKIHRWNSVNMGPKMDVVGRWEKAAHKQGLRFGVSEHLVGSFNWFQVSHGADKTGPLAGVPYDGADKAFEDLYHFPSDPADLKNWETRNPRFQQTWYDSIHELVSNYRIDLLYSDSGVAFGNEVGRSLVAHLYNTSKARNGVADAVYNCKQVTQDQWFVEDLERGVMPRVMLNPWQTDTSMGDWFYNTDYKYRPLRQTIQMLIDVVSKNGNLLLNVVQRPDGSIDPEVEQQLEELARWTAVNGAAIYDTRPWQVFGEGPTRAKAGTFNEDTVYSARDIRFTTKGETLFATTLGVPEDGIVRIRSLARPAAAVNQITAVRLLGSDVPLKFSQDDAALVVTLPAGHKSVHTCSLAIRGVGLQAVPIVPDPVLPDATGTVVLNAEDAQTTSNRIRTGKDGDHGKLIHITCWDDRKDVVTWRARMASAGNYAVTAVVASPGGTIPVAIDVDGQQVKGTTAKTDWGEFKSIELGDVRIGSVADLTISMHAQDGQPWQGINLRSVTFTKVP